MDLEFLQGKLNVPSNRVEQLYEAMLPNLPQYVVSREISYISFALFAHSHGHSPTARNGVLL